MSGNKEDKVTGQKKRRKTGEHTVGHILRVERNCKKMD